MAENKEITKRGASSLWEPFEGMRGFQRAMSHFVDDFFNGGHWRDWELDMPKGTTAWFPVVDIEETDKEYVFKADVPGLEKENVNVEVNQGMLIIRGERKEQREEKGKGYIRKEHAYGSFNRTFALPGDAKVDAVKAEYKNGVLTIRVGRAEELKPKSVKVEVQ